MCNIGGLKGKRVNKNKSDKMKNVCVGAEIVGWATEYDATTYSLNDLGYSSWHLLQAVNYGYRSLVFKECNEL